MVRIHRSGISTIGGPFITQRNSALAVYIGGIRKLSSCKMLFPFFSVSVGMVPGWSWCGPCLPTIPFVATIVGYTHLRDFGDYADHYSSGRHSRKYTVVCQHGGQQFWCSYQGLGTPPNQIFLFLCGLPFYNCLNLEPTYDRDSLRHWQSIVVGAWQRTSWKHWAVSIGLIQSLSISLGIILNVDSRLSVGCFLCLQDRPVEKKRIGEKILGM